MKRRTVFFISDRTGITAESLGLSLLSQFEDIHFTQITLPFVDSTEKAVEATQRIATAAQQDNVRPILISTIIDSKIKEILSQSQAYIIDFFQSFIPGLEQELSSPSANVMGRIHSTTNYQAYNTRIEAVNFALNFDDGARTKGYDTADLILVGVSRCGKTPTSLYLAMQFGVRAANYPITEEDLDNHHLPKALKPFQNKLFGLTIDPKRLHAIRSHRRPDSQYAMQEQCVKEVRRVEAMYQQENIPYLSSTNLSIEELATKILIMTGIERRLR